MVKKQNNSTKNKKNNIQSSSYHQQPINQSQINSQNHTKNKNKKKNIDSNVKKNNHYQKPKNNNKPNKSTKNKQQQYKHQKHSSNSNSNLHEEINQDSNLNSNSSQLIEFKTGRPNEVWPKKQRKYFCMAYLRLMMDNPRNLYYTDHWQRKDTLPDVAAFINKKIEQSCSLQKGEQITRIPKTAPQVKSYNQRVNKEWMLQKVRLKLKSEAQSMTQRHLQILINEYLIDNKCDDKQIEQVIQFLRQFEDKLNNESEYMKFINEQLRVADLKQKSKIDELLQQLQQKKKPDHTFYE